MSEYYCHCGGVAGHVFQNKPVCCFCFDKIVDSSFHELLETAEQMKSKYEQTIQAEQALSENLISNFNEWISALKEEKKEKKLKNKIN